jgi:imidazole glycerol-phosphate synthase subunit HisF
MLRHRVIPLVLLDGYSVVKTICFDIRRNLGNPIVVAKIYNARNVDELILLDIDATKENREIDLQTVESVASECLMPLTVGGGITTCDEISQILKAGADKVALNSIIFDNPNFLFDAVSMFGSQCIVASLDVVESPIGNYTLHSHAQRKVKFSLKDLLSFLMESKVGEVLLNNVDRDGTMSGYNINLIKYVASRITIPLIAAGGASGPNDCTKAIKAGASAVSAASIFHFTSITPHLCKEDMHLNGIPVRM